VSGTPIYTFAQDILIHYYFYRIGPTSSTLFWALFGMVEKEVVVIDDVNVHYGPKRCKSIIIGLRVYATVSRRISHRTLGRT
jgi:hypothetical protein